MAIENKGGILLLGIGNYLMGDEGIGVHLSRIIQPDDLPVNTDILDGGTGGFHLLEYFEKYEAVIMVDAALDELPVGTIRVIRPRFAADFPRAMSTHDIGMKDLVGALQLLGRMPDVWLITVSIESLQQQGIELTEEIKQAIPSIIETIRELAYKLASPEVVV